MKTEIIGNYKGHEIAISRTGHPQTQSVFVDGMAAGYVWFPNSALEHAKHRIDNGLIGPSSPANGEGIAW